MLRMLIDIFSRLFLPATLAVLSVGQSQTAVCQSVVPNQFINCAVSPIADAPNASAASAGTRDTQSNSAILKKIEPLLLFLFGLVLFLAATGIKLKQSRAKRAQNQQFPSPVSLSSGQSGIGQRL